MINENLKLYYKFCLVIYLVFYYNINLLPSICVLHLATLASRVLYKRKQIQNMRKKFISFCYCRLFHSVIVVIVVLLQQLPSYILFNWFTKINFQDIIFTNIFKALEITIFDIFFILIFFCSFKLIEIFYSLYTPYTYILIIIQYILYSI